MWRMWPRVDGLRAFGLGRPGEMRDRLNGLVLAGEKTATVGLWKVDYEPEGEALDEVGERQVLLGSDEAPLAIVEITRVESYAFADVPWEFAQAEGEGFESIEDWRERHRVYYAHAGLLVEDDDTVACVWFRVAEIVAQREQRSAYRGARERAPMRPGEPDTPVHEIGTSRAAPGSGGRGHEEPTFKDDVRWQPALLRRWLFQGIEPHADERDRPGLARGVTLAWCRRPLCSRGTAPPWPCGA